MNTANKRASAIMHMLPFRGLFPIPSGTVDQAARQQTDYAYAGIDAAVPPAGPSSRMSNIYLYPRGL